MCGIAGLLALTNAGGIDRELLDRMTDSLAHRGPDGRGVYIGPGVGFGHRRLAIIAPDEGAQPWRDESGGNALTYNGELYNYRQLRQQLQAEGVRFRSKTDTEVVFQALLHWGVDTALDRFRGMYAFALWEGAARRLTLARDPLGVKPLYWAMRDGVVRFGSEIKAILADKSFPRQPDITAVYNYLAHYRLSFRGETLFKQIHEVAPGSYVQWEGRRRRQQVYWQLPRIPEGEKSDPGADAVAEQLRAELQRSVKRRLIADVPVGAYLSGGIDSACLVTMIRALGVEKLKTFSIGFEQEGYNEFAHSDAMARHLGVEHLRVTMKRDTYFKELDSLIHTKDTPLSVPNEVPLRYLSRVLKKRVTVVLSGEGADEVLGGYQALARCPHDYLMARALVEGTWKGDEARRDHLRSALEGLYGPLESLRQRDVFLRLYQWTAREDRRSLAREKSHFEQAERAIADQWDRTWDELDGCGLDPYQKVLNILQEIHLGALLLRLDATSMAEGVEGRVPYTDRDFVEWAARLPLHYKTRWKDEESARESINMTAIEAAGKLDYGKYVLRLAFAGVIPDDILMRPKTAFPVPLDEWMYGPYLEWTKERVLTDKMGQLFNRKHLERLLETSRGRQQGMQLWMLANLGTWLEMYF